MSKHEWCQPYSHLEITKILPFSVILLLIVPFPFTFRLRKPGVKETVIWDLQTRGFLVHSMVQGDGASHGSCVWQKYQHRL